IAVTVAEANGCDYCLAAHSAVAATVGLSKEAVMDARRGVSPDRKVEAVLHFARQIVEKRGWVDDDDVGHLRDAGFGDREIVEIVANVAMSILTNYVNHVAGTEVDFPQVPHLSGT
ncbi:carboxymuconolactone decarboxylase family protein, partial [Planctomycetota bacterium]